MTGATIETTLELWAALLCDVKARMRPLFSQGGGAGSASSFLDGLLGDERHKTGWMRAEAAGDAGPFTTWCPAGTTMETLVGVEGHRWRGTVRNFMCGRADEHYAAMALMKRSPKMTANWALAMVHSRGGILHSFSERFKIR